MSAGKYAFGFISLVLLGSSLSTYLTHPDDGSSFAVPIILGVCGAIAAIVAWNIERVLRRPHKSYEGDDVGDIAMPRHDHHHIDADTDE